jgi:hypothetical protein
MGGRSFGLLTRLFCLHMAVKPTRPSGIGRQRAAAVSRVRAPYTIVPHYGPHYGAHYGPHYDPHYGPHYGADYGPHHGPHTRPGPSSPTLVPTRRRCPNAFHVKCLKNLASLKSIWCAWLSLDLFLLFDWNYLYTTRNCCHPFMCCTTTGPTTGLDPLLDSIPRTTTGRTAASHPTSPGSTILSPLPPM